MGTLPATQLKVGMTVVYDKHLYRVSQLLHVTPGKGRGMMQVKLYSLKSNSYFEKRFRSDETIETVYVERKEMEYLYQADDMFVFMDTTTYDQAEISAGVLGNAMDYILPNSRIKVQMHGEFPVGIELPNSVDLKVTETDPPLKGATASASPKSATLETGIVVKVPQFIMVGDEIRVDTRDNSFLERTKK